MILKKKEFQQAFALYISPNFEFKRKKIIKEFLTDLTLSHLVAIIEGNEEYLYSHSFLLEEFIGIELRYEKDISTWYSFSEEIKKILRKLMGETGKEKKYNEKS